MTITELAPGFIWHLELTSFQGIAPNATHWFAKLRGSEDFTLERRLTITEARRLQKKERVEWEAGETTNRFASEADAEDAGLAAWRSLAGPRDLLLRGNHCVADPQPVLAGPVGFGAIARVILDGCEKVGWWDGPAQGCIETSFGPIHFDRDEAMKALCDHWNLVLQHHNLQESPRTRRTHFGFGSPDLPRVIVMEKIQGAWTVVEESENPSGP